MMFRKMLHKVVTGVMVAGAAVVGGGMLWLFGFVIGQALNQGARDIVAGML